VQVPSRIQGTLFFFTILVALRYVLRNQWAAGVVAIFTFLNSLNSYHPPGPRSRPKKSLPTSSGCTPAAPKARSPPSITRSEVTKSSSATGQERIPVLFSIQPGLVQAVLRSSRCWCRFVVWRNRGLPLSS
jgi:hypothetical protein